MSFHIQRYVKGRNSPEKIKKCSKGMKKRPFRSLNLCLLSDDRHLDHADEGRQQRDHIADDRRKALLQHQHVVDSVIDDRNGEKTDAAARPEPQAVPEGGDAGVDDDAADDVHGARSKAADQKRKRIGGPVLNQVADVLEGRKTGDQHDDAAGYDFLFRFKHQQIEQQRQKLHGLLHDRRDRDRGRDIIQRKTRRQESADIGR